ncbi:hypothetical protein [Helicobacter gastrocanis]|uniref:hypothetical protein n=1 Tax=Helicobacter gastrocanis TaxID=2849641 RepID=UPI001C858A08|nr:hypothetical protein [Helicobacter sp. NHP19-003]
MAFLFQFAIEQIKHVDHGSNRGVVFAIFGTSKSTFLSSIIALGLLSKPNSSCSALLAIDEFKNFCILIPID